MIPDIDIFPSANALVKQHGADAPIEELLSKERPAGVTVQ